MRYLVITGFVLMVAAQWYAPLSMVWDSQRTVDQGVEYKFKTAPVDPSDPFRGKYITLSFEAETYHPIDTTEAAIPEQKEIYATLITDSLGYATVLQLSEDRPLPGLDYITTEIYYVYRDENNKPVINLNFPFTRYYLEESKASEAERLYWNNNRDTAAVCYATVSVHEGNSTLTDVMIGEKRIVDIVRELNAKVE
jgi:uncharacterized membrane-anchored protein